MLIPYHYQFCTELFAALETEAVFGTGRIDFKMGAFIPLGSNSFFIQIAVSSALTDKKPNSEQKACCRY
jgi:hypothetical protein